MATTRARPPLIVASVTGIAALAFLVVAVITNNYGAWGTGAAFLVVAAILTFLRSRP